MDSNSNQVVAQDPSPAQTSNQAANGDDSHTVIIGRDATAYKAAAKGNIEVLGKFSDHDLRVHLTPKHNTILHIAAQFGQLECVNLILSLPSSPTLLQRPNLKGDIPLHLAAREGHFEVVKALLDAAKKLPTDIETGLEADKLMLRMTNKEKDTALHEAVRYEEYDVVELLIEQEPVYTYGANVSGGTPLYMAAERGFTGIVKIILNKTRTSPAYSGFMGRTALHAAVLCNDEEMTEAILRWNPALTKEVDEKGWSPLHCAAERNCNPTIVRQLLVESDKSVAYLGIKDGNKTALHIASFHHHKNIIEELLFHYPDCCEQVDHDGHNVFHFSMMKNADHDYKPSVYFENEWLRTRGLVNEKDGQGNTPLHLLSSYQIFDERFILQRMVDGKASNIENLMAYDLISRANDISGKKDKILKLLASKNTIKKKNNSVTEMVMPDNRLLALEKKMSGPNGNSQCEVERKGEKYISKLKKRGEAHLIVSALITTVTFAAGFTLPGGYKEDEGMAILTKKTAFKAFVVTDTIAMVFSASAVFFHFFMTMHNEEDVVKKHLVLALRLTMLGMGAMVIAFATGLYAVLPHSSALSIFACIFCSCFFLSFFYEVKQIWRSGHRE